MKKLISMMATSAVALLGLALPATATPLPPFTATVHTVTATQLGKSWREGCPVPPEDLRLIRMTVLGFDGHPYRGELVVAEAVTPELVTIFARLYESRFPIERMETVDKYDADDDLSMAANNTSAFNC